MRKWSSLAHLRLRVLLCPWPLLDGYCTFHMYLIYSIGGLLHSLDVISFSAGMYIYFLSNLLYSSVRIIYFFFSFLFFFCFVKGQFFRTKSMYTLKKRNCYFFFQFVSTFYEAAKMMTIKILVLSWPLCQLVKLKWICVEPGAHCSTYTHPDSSNRLRRSHITQYRSSYCKSQYRWGYYEGTLMLVWQKAEKLLCM